MVRRQKRQKAQRCRLGLRRKEHIYVNMVEYEWKHYSKMGFPFDLIEFSYHLG